MNAKQLHFDRASQVTEQPIPTNADYHNPNTWLQSGYSPSEIILSAAILVRAIASLLAVLKSSSRPR
jgi:hypothetical protein